MSCKKCGNQLAEGDSFCQNCGTLVGQELNSGGKSLDDQLTVGFQQTNQPTYKNSSYSDNLEPKNNMMSIVIGIGSVLVVMVLTVVVLFVINGVEKDNNEDNITNDPIVKNESKINYEGTTLTIPSDINYDVSSQGLTLYDKTNLWKVSISIKEDTSFSEVIDRKDTFASYYNIQGMVVFDLVEETYDGVKMMTMYTTNTGTNNIFGFAEGDLTHVFIFAVMQNVSDYSILDKIAPIFKSAIFSESSSSITTDKDYLSIIKDSLK